MGMSMADGYGRELINESFFPYPSRDNTIPMSVGRSNNASAIDTRRYIMDKFTFYVLATFFALFSALLVWLPVSFFLSGESLPVVAIVSVFVGGAVYGLAFITRDMYRELVRNESV